ncbi:hypothetical protein BDP67DRAFT_517995 [Colletotrichum lupini]|nr:hypothetical protein BDP67DRAFT_517995 [Colletotrichum lupini]
MSSSSDAKWSPIHVCEAVAMQMIRLKTRTAFATPEFPLKSAGCYHRPTHWPNRAALSLPFRVLLSGYDGQCPGSRANDKF